MKLTTLSALNIKGQSFEDGLKALTIYTGPNGSGKTARLDALRLAILGNTATGKTNKAIFTLASAASMTAGVAFDTGERFTRTWKASGKSIKASTDGKLPDLDAVLFDGSLFLAAKPQARAAMIRERFPSATDPKAELLAEIRAKLGTNALPDIAEAEDLAEWLDAMGDGLTAQASAQRELVQRLKKTVQGIETLRLADDEDTALQHQAAGLETKRDTARTWSEACGRAAQALHTSEEETDALGEEYADHSAEHTPPPATPTVADLEAELKANTRQRDELGAIIQRADSARDTRRVLTLDLQASQRRIEEALAAGATDSYQDPGEVVDVVAIMRRTADLERMETLAKGKLDQATKELASLRDAAQHVQTCPHCGADAAHFGADYLQRQGKAMENAQVAVSAATASYNTAHQEAEAGRLNLTEARAAQERHNVLVMAKAQSEKLTAARLDVARINGLLGQLVEDDTGPQAEQLSDLNDQAAQINLALAAHKTHNALEALKARRDASAEKTSNLAKEYARAKAAEEAAQAAAKAAQEASDKLAGYEAETRRIAQAGQELTNAEAALAAYEAAHKHLKEQGVQIASKALAPVARIANGLCGEILPTPLAAFGIELGRWQGATFVPLDNFSGAERAVAVCAIQVALASMARFKLVVLDEFSRLDNVNKGRFITALVRMLEAQEIDQAIVLDNRECNATGPLVQVFRLTKS